MKGDGNSYVSEEAEIQEEEREGRSFVNLPRVYLLETVWGLQSETQRTKMLGSVHGGDVRTCPGVPSVLNPCTKR